MPQGKIEIRDLGVDGEGYREKGITSHLPNRVIWCVCIQDAALKTSPTPLCITSACTRKSAKCWMLRSAAPKVNRP